jgi:hypothetical protein
LGRPAENGGALDKLDAGFLMFGLGVPLNAELGEAIGASLDRLHAAMQPWAVEGGYLNFAERPGDMDEILPPDTCARLREIKRRVDPDAMIRANHPIS